MKKILFLTLMSVFMLILNFQVYGNTLDHNKYWRTNTDGYTYFTFGESSVYAQWRFGIPSVDLLSDSKYFEVFLDNKLLIDNSQHFMEYYSHIHGWQVINRDFSTSSMYLSLVYDNDSETFKSVIEFTDMYGELKSISNEAFGIRYASSNSVDGYANYNETILNNELDYMTNNYQYINEYTCSGSCVYNPINFKGIFDENGFVIGNSIENLIPKYYFINEGSFSYLGEKYGFYIDTGYDSIFNKYFSSVILIKIDIVNPGILRTPLSLNEIYNDNDGSIRLSPVFNGNFKTYIKDTPQFPSSIEHILLPNNQWPIHPIIVSDNINHLVVYETNYTQELRINNTYISSSVININEFDRLDMDYYANGDIYNDNGYFYSKQTNSIEGLNLETELVQQKYSNIRFWASVGASAVPGLSNVFLGMIQSYMIEYLIDSKFDQYLDIDSNDRNSSTFAYGNDVYTQIDKTGSYDIHSNTTKYPRLISSITHDISNKKLSYISTTHDKSPVSFAAYQNHYFSLNYQISRNTNKEIGVGVIANTIAFDFIDSQGNFLDSVERTFISDRFTLLPAEPQNIITSLYKSFSVIHDSVLNISNNNMMYLITQTPGNYLFRIVSKNFNISTQISISIYNVNGSHYQTLVLNNYDTPIYLQANKPYYFILNTTGNTVFGTFNLNIQKQSSPFEPIEF